ncbi:MAG: glycoside hydrolase family 127 protein [Lentisphaerae bacterium]|nr:glycoside hydrolase family 127 protein [Lentisphaerota bacterium]
MKLVPFKNVSITGGFWYEKQKINRENTLPIEYQQCKDTGRLDAWKLDWKPGMPNQPHVYWDSDVAKWIEAVGYSLAQNPDPELEKLADEVIQWMADAQQPDGYLNTHFTVVEPDKRWTNLRDLHELYCAGHLMEAAVAYYQGTGKRTLLDTLEKYADYIATVFGTGESQKRGIPGHEEIELALVRLAETTGKKKYLELASYFIEERGRQPHYFDIERKARGDESPYRLGGPDILPYAYNQSHLPVREQTTAEGHSVRACYLYAGMASVARETKDESLAKACKTLWNNITTKRMYVHGGIGSSRFGERFSFDYDLPNEDAYAETCAAISLVFFARNMLRLEKNADYANVLENTLYNGVISGISMDGKQFFYDNILASHPKYHKYSGQKSPQRQDWFGCACCPPNIARLIASISDYLYTQSDDTLWIHLFAEANANIRLKNTNVNLTSKTEYPWQETIDYTVNPDAEKSFTIAIRLPDWCDNPSILVNQEAIDLEKANKNGYAYITRTWKKGDKIHITFPMPVKRVYAHPSVRQNCGKVAIKRGPILYCLEECDNGKDLAALRLPPIAEFEVKASPESIGSVPMLIAPALRRDPSPWNGKLYSTNTPKYKSAQLVAIPYFLWANRGPGEMTIWINE